MTWQFICKSCRCSYAAMPLSGLCACGKPLAEVSKPAPGRCSAPVIQLRLISQRTLAEKKDLERRKVYMAMISIYEGDLP